MRGGTAQGIGSAVYEHFHYDEDGQLLAGTYADYLIPTLKEVPANIRVGHVETPSPFTEFGIKGGGEGGRMGAPPAIAAAVEDALRPLGGQGGRAADYADAGAGADSGGDGRRVAPASTRVAGTQTPWIPATRYCTFLTPCSRQILLAISTNITLCRFSSPACNTAATSGTKQIRTLAIPRILRRGAEPLYTRFTYPDAIQEVPVPSH